MYLLFEFYQLQNNGKTKTTTKIMKHLILNN